MRKSASKSALVAVEKQQDNLVVRKRGLNLRTIKKILELIEKTRFNEVEIEEGEFRIKVVKSPRTISRQPFLEDVASNVLQEQEADCFVVKSPLVGTFFRGPSPKAEPFVEIGDEVRKDQQLCIIAAMKLINKVEAEEGGKIVAILVENDTPVEYGEPLFKIKSSHFRRRG